VIIGVTARGQKRFLAIEDGVRESMQSWREALSSLKIQGMNAPKPAIGDGAMGFWAAMDEVYPTARQHKWGLKCDTSRSLLDAFRPQNPGCHCHCQMPQGKTWVGAKLNY
jgi:hypothetical protein